jgi:acetyltransferase-like isoleucine patch superfamily enzyme
MKNIIRALLLAIFPTSVVRSLVNVLGYNLEPGARVGFSWVCCDNLEMSGSSRIWHFSKLTGPFSAILAEHSYIGHFINITRGRMGVSYGGSVLTLGRYANVTSRHRLDLCQSISIGDFSTIAGNGSQLWTHGYIHEETGLERYRIDGGIIIGKNVYIGSMCFISMGVQIADGIIVGGGSSVAKNLSEPGMYVSGSLRYLPRPQDPDTRTDLTRVDPALSVDRVYRKREAS